MFIEKAFEKKFHDIDYLIFNYGENIKLVNVAIPRGAHCGLYIFIQSDEKTNQQEAFIKRLRKNNYCSCVCKSIEELINFTEEYLRGKDWSKLPNNLNDFTANKYKASQ